MMNSQRFFTIFDLDLLHLKNLGRFRQKLIKQRTRTKILLTSYLDQSFPELQYFFKSGIHHNTCYTLLKEATSPAVIASIHLTHLTHLLEKVTIKQRWQKDALTITLWGIVPGNLYVLFTRC